MQSIDSKPSTTADSISSTWSPLDPSIRDALQKCDNPIGELAKGNVPAIILRRAYPQKDCQQLVQRFYERDLALGLPKPGDKIEGRGKVERVDVGTSLHTFAREPDRFFDSARQTHKLFEHLFDGLVHPVKTLYSAISSLAPGKQAVTAYEPDGRRYGPAIFRCHMPYWGYAPHFDSVRRREKRTGYAVHRFQHQLAGILLLQSAELTPENSCQSILYRVEVGATPKGQDQTGISVDTFNSMDPDAFRAYVSRENIPHYQMVLEPGDMYFFNSEFVHEVPMFTGNQPRINMATFFGYSPAEQEIFVWS